MSKKIWDTAHDMKCGVGSEPHIDRVELALMDPGVRVAAAHKVNERVADGQPAPRHAVHVAGIPGLLADRNGQLLNVAKIDQVVVLSVLFLETLDLALERRAYRRVVMYAHDPVRIVLANSLNQALHLAIVELVAAVERVRDNFQIRSAAQCVVKIATESGRGEPEFLYFVCEVLSRRRRFDHVMVARLCLSHTNAFGATFARRCEHFAMLWSGRSFKSIGYFLFWIRSQSANLTIATI